jgi:hypothetical protein
MCIGEYVTRHLGRHAQCASARAPLACVTRAHSGTYIGKNAYGKAAYSALISVRFRRAIALRSKWRAATAVTIVQTS